MVEDVRNWLVENGFERFVDSFEYNEVDWALLLELTNEDLKDLGVSKLADRKRILAALPSENAALDAAPEASAYHASGPEHRQLTVVFCDLVGSTELATRVDAEAYRAVIRQFHTTCANAVRLHGGFVAQYLGDGVLVYFGYPVADEDDAERAVTAGLEVLSACRASNVGSVRVGIASGSVIVGDLIGSGSSQQTAVTGETPNLAARLQSLARSNTVVISSATKLLAGNGFEYVELGNQHVKGFSTPVSVWQVVRTRAVESRFESSRGAAIQPLLGRDNELNLLLDRWQLACGSEGQVVFLSGEAGIGKSRLLEGLRQEVKHSSQYLIRYQCVPNRVTSALYPVIVQLQRAAYIETGDSTDTKLDKIETFLQISGAPNPDELKIFAHLLSIPFEHRYGALTESPAQTKARTLEILVSQLVALAERGPVLFLLEDAQWADPASEELLELVISRIQQSRVLLLVTHRTDWKPALQGYNISSLQLNRLGKSYCADLVRLVAGGFLNDAAVNRIVSRTDGIPLFIEELTKTLVEGGLDITAVDIPETLRASLLARIDRLSAETRELVQLGSVIGREIPLDLLRAVFEKQDSFFNEGIEQLVQAELLHRSGQSGKQQYSFNHALVQDSVYGSMLSEVRSAHHLKVADTLVNDFQQTVEAAPELAAYHFTEAGSYPQALSYWHQAGRRSASRSADAEAVAQLNSAIDILDRIEETPEHRQTRLELHIDLSGPLIATSGYSSAEMDSNTQKALSLSEELGESSRLFPILYSRLVYHLHTGEVGRACSLAEDFLVLAQRNGDRETIVQGHRLVGFSKLIAGEPPGADSQLRIAANFETSTVGASSPSVYGQDIEATAKVLSAWARLHCGFPVQAVELFDRAWARAKEINHLNTLGVVLFHGANMFVSMRLQDRVNECLSEFEAINREHDQAIWQTAESIVRAGLLSLRGEHQQALTEAQSALARYDGTLGMKMHVPFIQMLIADAHLHIAAADKAIAVVEEALLLSRETGSQLEYPELLRIAARAHNLQHGFGEKTRVAYNEAIDTAQTMQMKWYELRVVTEYAALLHENDATQQAIELISPVVASMQEGADFPDLIDANSLLATLNLSPPVHH